MSENLPEISLLTFLSWCAALQGVFWLGFLIGSIGNRRLTKACKAWEEVVGDYKKYLRDRDEAINRLMRQLYGNASPDQGGDQMRGH